MDKAKLQAWWWTRQGLDRSLSGKPPAAILERAGWARSVGGVGPYLTLFSRGGVSREQADSAVAKLDIHELPSARGCAYVLPASHYALGLKVGAAAPEAEMKVARKLGVTDWEIDRLCTKVLDAFTGEPLDPEGLRDAVGGAARSLGEEGKKKGVTTTLPLALGKLQSVGEIRRVPNNGRLDQQRFRYTRWHNNPLKTFQLSDEEAFQELARLYFNWIGPATLAEFQWFAGLSGKAAKAAVEPLKLVAVEDRFLLPEDADSFAACKPSRDPDYVAVSSLDSIAALRREINTLLADSDLQRPVVTEKGKTIAAFSDLPDHAILDRGRIVGLWEFDTETNSVAWVSFVESNAALKAAIRKVEEYVQKDLGDARSFSLDSPKSRAPRIQALRAAV